MGDVILTVEVSQPGEGVVLVRCDGEVDPSTCDRLIEAIEWSFTPTLRLLRLNFLAVTFMDSTGVQCMVRAQDRCAEFGVRLEVVASEPVRRLFQLTGLDRLDGLDPRSDGTPA